jgi:RNA binding exosome subunit
MANALALVVRMLNTVAHLVRTVAIYLAIHLSEAGRRFDTRRAEGYYGAHLRLVRIRVELGAACVLTCN